MNLNDFQKEVGEWGEATFTQSTIATIHEHLRRETVELQQDIERWQRMQEPVKPDVVWPTIMEEIADIVLISLHLAHRRGFSLAEVINQKFQIAQARKLGEPDSQGVVEHVCDCCGKRPCACEGSDQFLVSSPGCF